MKIHRLPALVVATALLAGSVPATTFAADDGAAIRRSLVSRESIQRAVKDSLAARAVEPSRTAPAAPTPAAAPRRRQGGGKGMMVMTIVGTLVGVGTTYYLLKEMKKTQDPGDQ